MRIDILSLFPEYFQGPFDVSILKRARDKGLLDIHLHDIRTFSKDKWRKVDDRPCGGGPGMVMMPQPIADAIRSVKTEESLVVYLSPQGEKLTAALSEKLAQQPHLILLCGHYEGVDERVIEKEVDLEISIGDYVLTNGCIAAIALVDATARFIPGVLGNEEGASQDSFQDGKWEGPQYTGQSFEEMPVPEVLKSGNHAHIKKWREEQGQQKQLRIRSKVQ